MGTGFSFDKISEKSSFLESSGGKASGPISFMQVFNECSKTVEQGGVRRGANMGILGVDHPDIEEFIECKNKKVCDVCGEKMGRNEFNCPSCDRFIPEDSYLNYFNLSVGLSDEFIKLVLKYQNTGKDSDWCLISRRTGKIVKVVKVSELWNKICYNAWYSGEPGIINLDAINDTNPVPDKPIESTNPCGEQPLRPYESCNLGSLNLDELSDDDGVIDLTELQNTIELSVRFLDNVIEANHYAVPEIEEETKKYRSIGLGVMGLSRLLQKRGLPYGSGASLSFVQDVMKKINEIAKERSHVLALERGSFPAWGNSIYADEDYEIRNATRTTIAPTGSISLIADTSGGIEPDFTHRFTKTVKRRGEGEYELIVENDTLVKQLKKHGIYSDDVMKAIEENGGRMIPATQFVSVFFDLPLEECANLKNPKHIRASEKYSELKEVFKTAGELSPKDHVLMQVAVQNYVDNAVSKTVNLPNEATESDISEIYLLALQNQVKGITVYRDGSRQMQPNNFKKKEEPKKEEPQKVVEVKNEIDPPSDYSLSIKRRLYTGCGKLYLHLDYDKDTGQIKEVFIDKGSDGGCKIFTKATSRLISVGIRGGIPLEVLVEQLNSAGSCPSYQLARGKGKELSKGMSCPSAIGKDILKVQEMLKKDIPGNTSMVSKVTVKEEKVKPEEYNNGMTCPECKARMNFESGCVTCLECGFSKC